MSVRLCDPPSVPGPFPLSCPPRCLLPGPSGHRGTAAGPGVATPTPCRGWEGHWVVAESCCCRSVFTTPRDEMKTCASPPLLRGREQGWGRCSVPPTSSQCYYAKAAAGSSAWREAMRPQRGSAPPRCPGGSPPTTPCPAEVRGEGQQRCHGAAGTEPGSGEQHPGGGSAPWPCPRETGSDCGGEEAVGPILRRGGRRHKAKVCETLGCCCVPAGASWRG